jgi:lipoprotein-releasing system permease protein
MKLPLLIGLRYTGAQRNSQLVSFFSGVSITGLVVGVGLLITVLSIMNGFDRELRQKILALVPQAAVYERGGTQDWWALQSRLEMRPRIQAAAPFIQLDGLVSHRGNAQPVVLYGVVPEEEARVSRLAEFLSDDVLRRLQDEPDQLVLGHSIAERLGVTEGEQLMVVVPGERAGTAPRIHYFTLLKILHTRTELDNSLAISHLTSAARLTATPEKITGMRLRVDDLFAAREVVWQALNELGRSYYGTSWQNTHGNLYQAIHMSKKLVALLMSLIVAIAAFNVVSTLVMVVVEKQGDIAILRTLGASTGEIMAIFMVQGTLIGIIGTVLGVVCGVLLSWLAQPLLRLFEILLDVRFLKSDVYPLTYLPIEISPADILQVSVTAMLMSFLATLYPAWRASRTRPAEILRYE